jgi:cytochrome P450
VVFLRLPGTRLYLINHPRLIEQVLSETNKAFINHKGMRTRPALRLFRSALLTVEGTHWQDQRRLTFPAFRHERIAEYAEAMVRCTEQMLATWRDGDVRDLHQELIRLNLEIVAKTLFNSDLNGKVAEIAAAFDILKEGFVRKHWLQSFGAVLALPVGRRFEQAARRLDEIVDEIIRERKTKRFESSDLLSILMGAEDEENRSITDERLRREVVTFLFTGHKAIGIALAWTWYLIAQHADTEFKLRQELHTVLGDSLPTVSAVPHLPYTTMIVHEALRLYPPGWAIGREAMRDCEVGGYHVPAGTQLVLSQWVTQRDPRFFDRPDEFLPERWSNDLAKRLPKYAYFPYGGGARSCLGRAFAEMNAVLVLATMAQRFQIKLVPNHKVELIPSFALIPSDGIKVVVSASISSRKDVN